MIRVVVIAKRLEKKLGAMPLWLVRRLKCWVRAVETEGLESVRKLPGYHDEPLQGVRFGQRSIRLNRSWRAIYVVRRESEGVFVSIEEVVKHAY